jgi:tetratricopeptide (TPR) repeat protein
MLKDLASGVFARQPDPEALHQRGLAMRESGRTKEARDDLVRAAELAPDQAEWLFDAAAACYALGDHQLALEYCERARRIAPGLSGPSGLQAQINLGGEHYTEVLARVFEQLRPRTYVEIGIFQGQSLQLAKPPTIAIGIDPEPRLARAPAANHRIFAETSDAFFAGRDLIAELGGVPVDLAFIDGMHHFEHALRDFTNLERFCTRRSVILIHDCYPLDRETAERIQPPGFWSGDVWRLIVLLKKYRPDLAIDTIGAPPTGLGVVRNLDPGSRVLQENYSRLCDEFLCLDYSCLDRDKPQELNLFPNDPEKIRALLGGS